MLAKNYSEHAAQQFVDNPENFKQGAIKCVGFDNALYQALVDKKAFKSTQKAMLTGLLEELDVRVAMKKNAVLRR